MSSCAELDYTPFDYWRDRQNGVSIDAQTEELIERRVKAGFSLMYLYDCVNIQLLEFWDNFEIIAFYRTIQAKLEQRLRDNNLPMLPV